MKQYALGVLVGAIGTLLVFLIAVGVLLQHYHVDPQNLFLFDKSHVQGVYIVQSPGAASGQQAQRLIEANMLMINTFLELDSETHRIIALQHWALILMCGIAPDDPECDGGKPRAPEGKRL